MISSMDTSEIKPLDSAFEKVIVEFADTSKLPEDPFLLASAAAILDTLDDDDTTTTFDSTLGEKLLLLVALCCSDHLEDVGDITASVALFEASPIC